VAVSQKITDSLSLFFSSCISYTLFKKLLERGEDLPCVLNKKYGKENNIIEDYSNLLMEANDEK
jgi:hypothetical protein